MVGPGFFETVRQQLDGRRPLAVPYEKTGRRGTKSTHHPKNIFHYVAPSLCSDAIFLDYLDYDAPRRLDAAKFWSVAGGGLRLSRVTRERLHFRVWIRFDSVVRLGLERV
jgi:hypothetical protein